MKAFIYRMGAALLCCCALCLGILPIAARAASTADATEAIRETEISSLTLTYGAGETAFDDVAVQLYRIASVSADFRYTPCEEFRAAGLTLNGIGAAAEWDAVRTTLESYIVLQAITPLSVRYTDADGVVRFDGLLPGLYFVMPVQAVQEDVHVYFASVLTAVPALHPDGTWNYDAAVQPKPTIETDTPEGDREYTVVKLWRDAGDDGARPTQIDVRIFRDGVCVETVTLSAENNWSYTWTAEADGAFWTVSETDVPAGYTASVEVHGNVFTLVNTVSDAPQESPPTGETVNLYLCAVVLCLSGILFLAIAALSKRKPE